MLGGKGEDPNECNVSRGVYSPSGPAAGGNVTYQEVYNLFPGQPQAGTRRKGGGERL